MTEFDAKEFLEANPKPWESCGSPYGYYLTNGNEHIVNPDALLAYTEHLEAEVERLKVENKQLGDDLRATEFNRQALISGYEKIRTSLREQRDKLKAEAALSAEALEVGRLVLRLPELPIAEDDTSTDTVGLKCVMDWGTLPSWLVGWKSNEKSKRYQCHETALEALRAAFKEVGGE